MNSVLKELMNGAATNNMDEFELGMTLAALIQLLNDDVHDFEPEVFDFLVDVKAPQVLEYWRAKYKDEIIEAGNAARESASDGE